ncbi:glycosyl transferase family 1 [Acinetobacter sp. WZC-1]|uniref:glycosyl transferase family 1 n=1 Tax=Acinetobacter sp. WZC-1 TaxID=3459034 RepID=UPI00403DDD84
MILFLSKYPQTPEQYRDGFFQRVENIDQFYLDDERVYLNASFFKNLRKNVIENGLRTEITCNVFFHFFTIFKLFKSSSLVYIQSIYNALNLFLFIVFFKKFYVLDLHGVVPEELEMQNKKKYAVVFSILERMLFQKIDICIAVTNRMVNYFKSKYSESKVKYIVYAILPSHLKSYKIGLTTENEEKIEIIYSGNAQVWQNVDLMLKAIKCNLSEKIRYTILTGEPETFYTKLKEHRIGINQVTIKSVKPEELEKYYKSSHYGFVLRDDIIVNQVACPTKIIEYLNYGIIPIVLSEKIGDFEEYGYEYVFLNELNEFLGVRKSEKNILVVDNIYDCNNFDLKKTISYYQ